MGFLRKLFGGEPSQPKDTGIYIYVQYQGCDEVVRLRLEPRYELVPRDDDSGYTSRKTIVGTQCMKPISATFYFDGSQRLTSADLSGGELVDEATWQQWYDAQQAD